ncbi:hypothetical protein AMS68_008022 [Peltaster fructicola]|uniref:Trafficking protein particle complex subunit 10 n=1 Tax=Peltaster fructicola TaxID=286661 RepID=A0A6H0Y6H9_9PEZI|nr:hypothetical protein AMS68_008022 [Peltaster fructicola]
MEVSSSSKVTVEYHDPSGVFPLIARDLTNRLPLRNLNWQSNARPLRQIKHLHVEFVPSAETQAALRTPTTQNNAPANSIDILRSGFEPPKPVIKERKHQIPGLKTTPYLKIYVLRCDDKDWYKQEERRKLKEWVHEIKNEDGKHEHHDATEWLILHVVIPDTVAASEPRWRESSRDRDELKERSKGTGKLLGKSQKTVLDRLRADFGEGRSTHDHIAQIRLSKSQIAVDLLPVPALARTIEESTDEREKSWSDLMSKIRSAILSSFDTRVRQYEEDIAEQEARRSFPGWNFCTFFIHKEGLARALESVGLVEDALGIYDELSLGLENVLSDIASGEAAQTATSFTTAGSEAIDRIVGHDTASHGLFDKGYREEIVRSTISVFDFFCYLFERQMALILRLAGRSAATAVSGVKEGGDDLVMLAEICWRGLSFLHNGARTLKQDLLHTLPLIEAQSLVLSWTYAAAELVLTRTQSSHLDLTDQGIKLEKETTSKQTSHRVEFGFSMGADAYPQRNSSLPIRKSAQSHVKSVTSTSSAGRPSEDGLFSPPSSSGTDGTRPAAVPGLAELAAYRAELLSLQRKSLDLVAAMKGWYAGWAALAKMSSLDDDDATITITNGDDTALRIGRAVAINLHSRAKYEDAFATLTETAARHYLLATHIKSAETFMGDLAVLQYFQHDFASAATYFKHALPMLEADGWHALYLKALILYIDCLQRLEQYDEAVIASIKLQAKVVEQYAHATRMDTSDELITKAARLSRMLDLSEHLAQPLVTPLYTLFPNLQLSHEISHRYDRDGFCYKLRFEHVMQDVVVDNIALQLVHVENTSIAITLRSTEPVKLTQGMMEVELDSNVTAYGMFNINDIEIRVQKLIFRHELRPKPPIPELVLNGKDTEQSDLDNDRRPHLLVYPAARAINVKTSLASTTVVHKARHIAIELDSAWNDINTLDIRLKPATAGLRLHLDEINTQGIVTRPSEPQATGTIALGSLQSGSKATVAVRYSVEQAIPELSVRVEVHYTTSLGAFVALQDARLSTQLPLDVEVKDTFYLDRLLSTFTVRTTNQQPVILDTATLHDSEAYTVDEPPVSKTPTIVLAQQPVDFVYKIGRKSSTKLAAKQDSALMIAFSCVPLQELVTGTIAAKFKDAIGNSHFASLQRLMLPLIETRCSSAFTNADLELAALTHETKMPSFADVGWFEIIDTLPIDTQRPLSDWLMKWHIDNQRVALNGETSRLAHQKLITIQVDVLRVEHVFLASIHQDQARKGVGEPMMTIGSPTKMQLQLCYTRQWSTDEGQSQTKSSRRPDFVYELHAEPDVWLLSGRRRACFTAADRDGVVCASFYAVPLKSGEWPLPTVTVRPVTVLEEEYNGGAPTTCEASCSTAGQVVHVIKHEQSSRLVVLENDGSNDI